jgi:hypothetical protein
VSTLVIARTSQATWARDESFGIFTVATLEHALNTHYIKPSKENESTLYIWIPHISILECVVMSMLYLRPTPHPRYEQYLFPAQAQVISACAELAKRLVSGQGLACEDDKGSVSNWITIAPKPETKGDSKLASTLVVVGCVPYAEGSRTRALTSAQYLLHRKRAHRERFTPCMHSGNPRLTAFPSYCESSEYVNIL